ncbi:MAG TPA: hypothetical protein VGL92_13495 [Acidimicrobiia bacterium]|jgi:hypothetical protein
MRFEELSYRVDGPPVSVPFHPRLTVVGPLGGRARAGWIERAFGVLLGSRPGDGVGLVFRDHAGQQVRLERDHHGAARITGVRSGDDYTPTAGNLPLDGRFDWFASVGLDSSAARSLVRLVPSDFKGEDVDPWQTEDELCEVRALLAQVESEYETVMARAREADALYRRVEDLDEQLGRLEEEEARRRHAEALQAVRRLEAKAVILRDAVASERAAAEMILAAAEAGEEWRRAADSLEVARLALGDRPALVPEIPREPSEVEGSAGDGALLSELEIAHQAVEETERDLDRARIPALAMVARRRLAHARRREQAVLARMGFSSWLAFQITRVEVLLGHDDDVDAVHDSRQNPQHPVPDPDTARAERTRDARLRHTVAEAESACGVAQDRLRAHLARAGLLPPGDHPDDLAAQVSALAQRAAAAAVERKTPPTGAILTEVEAELSVTQAALAAFSRPDWDEHPLVSDTPLPDPEPLLEERARLFEEAYRIERALPDVGRLEEGHGVLTRRIAGLEAASRAGYQLMAIEEAEMVLLGRVTQARQVGPRAEPIPLLVDDALAGYEREDKHDLLHLLARLAEATQVVYLTDDPVTLEWASARVEEGEALVVAPPTMPPPTVASVA